MKLSISRRVFLASAASLALLSAGSADAAGLTLTLWHNTSDAPAHLNLYKAYEAESGNTINLVDIPASGFEATTQTKWATGERPDILEWHASASSIKQLNGTENFQDLSNEDFATRSPDLYKRGGALDGKVYAAIVNFPSVFGLYYNKDVLAKAGLKPPQNIDELFAACATLKEKVPGVAPMFEAGGSAWPVQLFALIYAGNANVDNKYAMAVMDKSVAINDPNGTMVKAITAYAQLRDKGCFNADATSAKFEDSLAAVLNGKTAIVAQHSDMLVTIDAAANGDKAKVDQTVGFVGFAADSPRVSAALSPFGTYYLPKTGDAEKEAAARDFARFVTGKGYQAFVNDTGMPPVLASGQAPSPLRPIIGEIKAAYDQGVSPMWDSTITLTNFAAVMSQVLAGQLEPQAAADQLAIQLKQQAKLQGIPGW